MAKTYQVRVKKGCRHGRLHADYDAKRPTGNPGPYALAGEVIEVTQAELDNFGDKFTPLDPVSAVLSAPNGKPASERETIERLAVELKQARSAQLEAELEASNLRAAAKPAAKPPTRRGRSRKAAPAKEA